jgi:hypothetical protein
MVKRHDHGNIPGIIQYPLEIRIWIWSLSENPLGHDMAGSALSARRAPGANTHSGLGSGEEHRGRAEDAVPAAGGVSFRAGWRCLFGGKTALGIPPEHPPCPARKPMPSCFQWIFGQALGNMAATAAYRIKKGRQHEIV